MATDNCITELEDGLSPSCEAIKKVGGVKKRVWITQLDKFNYSTDVDGYVSEISMLGSPANTMKQFVGKKEKNKADNELQIGENVNTMKQNVDLTLYYYTPAERTALVGLAKAEDVVVFIETNAGQIEVYGIDNGLNASKGTGSTGHKLNDSQGFMLSLTGEETDLPKVLKPTGTTTMAEWISYLDGLSE